MQQKGLFRRCRVRCKWGRPGRGDGVHMQRGRSVIYDCLVDSANSMRVRKRMITRVGLEFKGTSIMKNCPIDYYSKP